MQVGSIEDLDAYYERLGTFTGLYARHIFNRMSKTVPKAIILCQVGGVVWRWRHTRGGCGWRGAAIEGVTVLAVSMVWMKGCGWLAVGRLQDLLHL